MTTFADLEKHLDYLDGLLTMHLASVSSSLRALDRVRQNFADVRKQVKQLAKAAPCQSICNAVPCQYQNDECGQMNTDCYCDELDDEDD